MKWMALALLSLVLVGCRLPSSTASDADITNDTPGDSQKPALLVPVSGSLSYQDRFYNHNGFIQNNTPDKAIRFVTVDIVTQQGEVLGSALTNASGEFAIDDIPEGNHFLRVTAQHRHPSGSTISIRDAQANLYVIEQPITVSIDQSTVEFRATISDRVAGIFNMLDVFTIGFDFVETLELNQYPLEDLNVFWQWRETEGSYTCRVSTGVCPNGAGITVLSDPYYSGDTDEFDDDVLWHELAHHIETSLGMLDSAGGAHSLTDYQLDLRLAWSEGMASAFSLSVKKWLRANDAHLLSIPNAIGEDYSNYYVDTMLNTTSVSVDLLAANSVYFRYATNEAAVTSTILRMQNLNGIKLTWATLFNALASNSHADTLEAYWDAHVGVLQPSASSLQSWQTILASKFIYYELDDSEQDDSVNSAQPLLLDSAQFHSLYRNYYSVDEDWFSLSLSNGSTYQIKTFDLTNGADTQLELFDADYQLVATNDDAFDCELKPGHCSPLHNGSNFSSLITFTATADSTYFVRVRTSESVFEDPVNYGYLARYGSYHIKVSESP